MYTATLQTNQLNTALLLLFGRKKNKEATRAAQETPVTPAPATKPKSKRKGIAIDKYEIKENLLKFFVMKGLFKKRWVVIKEIPIAEISNVESFGNELSITWKDATDLLVLKKKSETFTALREQVLALLEERQITLEKDNKASLRRSDLLGLINSTVGVVDLSFDLLMGLQVKRVDWSMLEGHSKSLGPSISFSGQTIPSLTIDFSNISSAINNQVVKETSKETLSVLKTIYGYFDGLKLEEDLSEPHPNFKDAKAVVTAYYTLNDLLLGKIVGDKDSKKEVAWLETVLQGLAAETNFKVSFEELTSCIDRMGVEVDGESVVEDARGIFRQQLKML